MRSRSVLLAVALVMAPSAVRAADLVVWWDKGYYAEEDAALREIIAAFEQKTGKRVELVLRPQEGASRRPRRGARGRPAPGLRLWQPCLGACAPMGLRRSARRPFGGHRQLYEHLRSGGAQMGGDAQQQGPGRRPSTACPSVRGRTTSTSGRSFLKSAGFELSDIPQTWAAFWSFWCDEVQPAIRRATGREDIWAVGLSMSTRGVRQRR